MPDSIEQVLAKMGRPINVLCQIRERTRTCSCGVIFHRASPTKVRCDACQKARERRRNAIRMQRRREQQS